MPFLLPPANSTLSSNGWGRQPPSLPNSFDGFRTERHVMGRGGKVNRYEPWIQSPSVSKFDGEFSCLLKRAKKKKKRTMQPLSHLSVSSAKAIVGFHQLGLLAPLLRGRQKNCQLKRIQQEKLSLQRLSNLRPQDARG